MRVAPEGRGLSLLQVVGPYRDRCSEGYRTRLFSTELRRSGLELRLLRIPKAPALTSSELVKALEGCEGRCAAQVVLHFCRPTEVTTAVAPGAVHVSYSLSNEGLVPRDWLPYTRRLALTLVPSEYSRTQWLRAGIAEDRVAVCPPGVDTRAFRPDVAPLAIADARGRKLSTYTHRVLSVCSLREREALVRLVRAWRRATIGANDAVLILVLSETETPERMQQLLAETKVEDTDGSAPVVVITQAIAEDRIPSLFAAATVYVCASKGEEWDDALLQAAATGLRLIAPMHSVYAELLSPALATLLPESDEALALALARAARGDLAPANVRAELAQRHDAISAAQRLRAQLEAVL